MIDLSGPAGLTYIQDPPTYARDPEGSSGLDEQDGITAEYLYNFFRRRQPHRQTWEFNGYGMSICQFNHANLDPAFRFRAICPGSYAPTELIHHAYGASPDIARANLVQKLVERIRKGLPL